MDELGILVPTIPERRDPAEESTLIRPAGLEIAFIHARHDIAEHRIGDCLLCRHPIRIIGRGSVLARALVQPQSLPRLPQPARKPIPRHQPSGVDRSR